MSKLAALLSDASRSGVYRTHGDAEVDDATTGSGLDVVHIDLAGDATRAGVLAAFARALDFPGWYGNNWDALEDCLCDLSWRPGRGRVLLIEGAPCLGDEDAGVLRDILEGCAHSWAERAVPFFAVFVDPQGVLDLPELFRRAR